MAGGVLPTKAPVNLISLRLAQRSAGEHMNLDYLIGGGVTVLLLVYLVYVLLRPERF
jgi:K+-transporting ATPase KdpF subunit